MVLLKSGLIKIYGWALCLFLMGAYNLAAQQVKTYYVPKDVKIEENVAKETVVHNLSEEELYRFGPIYIIDGFIYFQNRKPYEIVKLTLQGKAVLRNRNQGTGPGEFKFHADMRPYKDKIADLDDGSRKIIIFTKDLEFLREFKVVNHYMGFFVRNENEFVFFSGTDLDSYFFVHDSMGKFLRKFGKRVTTKEENDRMFLFDSVRCIHYIPESDGIWASFKNRYDLRYYEKEKFKLEIKGPKGYFKSKDEDYGGRKVRMFSDRAVYLSKVKDRLFFFYWKDGALLVDLFDLNNYRLVRRIKFRVVYQCVTHYNGNVFYALGYSNNEEQDLLLYKLEI